MNKEKDILSWIQDWFSYQCNGDWEHNTNFLIRNIDNPGWSISINIEGTNLENSPFPIIDIQRTNDDQVYCKLEENKFNGFGGVHNLTELLSIFKSWAENQSYSQ